MTCDICNDDQFPAELVDDKLICIECQMKPTELPNSVLKCLTAEVRKEIGQKTAAEAEAMSEIKLERELHKLISSDLLRRRSEGQSIHWIHSRMDKRTTNAVGTADFFVIRRGEAIAIECKVGNNKLSVEQEAERLRVLLAGGHYHVVRTFDEYRKAVP